MVGVITAARERWRSDIEIDSFWSSVSEPAGVTGRRRVDDEKRTAGPRKYSPAS
jgi:hypothetical protein